MLAAIRNLPIGVKASAASLALLLCIVGVGGQALLMFRGLKAGVGKLSTVSMPWQRAVTTIQDAAVNSHVDLFRYVAWTSTGVNPQTLSTLNEKITSDLNQARAQLHEWTASEKLSPPTLALVEDAEAKLDRYMTAVGDTIEISTTDPALGTMMLGGTDDDYKRFAASLATLAARASAETTQEGDTLVSKAEESILVIVGVGIAAVVLGFVVAMLLVRSLVGSVRMVTKAMRSVSTGDTSADLENSNRRDEIGQMISAIIVFRDKLESDNRLLAAREKELLTQNKRFDAALTNMSQGLAMFDHENRLLVANARYAELYQIPTDLIRPGTLLRDIFQQRVAAGTYHAAESDRYVGEIIDDIAARRNSDRLIKLGNSRVIALSLRVMDGGWVSTHEDVTERLENEQRIIFMARHDPLTELPNRVHFRERMGQAVAEAQRGKIAAVLSIDLDRFKEVNDTLGHPAGDQLLKSVAQRLRKSVRETDSLARLGGDEFAVVERMLSHPDEATALAGRLIEAISEPYIIDGHEVVVGASIGIALALNDGVGVDEVLKNADLALYRAKAEGRGSFRFFEPQMDARQQTRRKLEFELRRALTVGQFELYYQPIIGLEDNRVVGFEALIRWHHPDCGVVPPEEFIPIAEEIGLIGSIGEWVLHEACKEAATWPGGLQIAVNLSPAQFRKNLVPCVLNALAASGLQAGRLELEITESALLLNNETTLATLQQLHDLGVHISMDDFGTGYSSLSYLHSFPFDRIKIDRSFVSELETRSECVAIIKAVAGLGHSLGMRTTAEGVETLQQLEQLRSQGCTEVQGYLFSKPKPAAELRGLIAEIKVRLAA